MNNVQFGEGSNYSPERAPYGTLYLDIIEFVRKNPGCDSRDVKRVLGYSAAAYLSILAKRSLLDRDFVEREDGRMVWKYWIL